MNELSSLALLIADLGLLLLTSAQRGGKPCTKQDWEPCIRAGYTFYSELNTGKCLRVAKKSVIHNSTVCSTANGSLIEISTQEEQQFYEVVFQHKDFVGKPWFWLDLLYSSKYGYYWRRKKGAALTYTNWLQGKPSNPGQDMCPAISTTSYKWETHPCADTLHAVCETATSATDLTSRRILTLKLRSLDVLKPGDVLRAECVSLAPPNYILTWFRSGDNFTQRLATTTVKHSEKFTLNRKKECQRRLTATLKAAVERTWAGTDTVTCELRRQDDTTGSTCSDNTYCREIKIQVKLRPPLAEPLLEIDFHHKGNKVFRGRYIIAKCSSCPKAHHYKFEVTQNLLNGSSETDEADLSDPRVHNFGLSRRFVKYDSDCPRLEVLSLEIKAHEMLKSLVVKCKAWNVAKYVVVDRAESPAITVTAIAPPSMPVLYVEYHEQPNILYNEQNLTANCSACLGDEGKIYWAVEDKHGSLPDAELNLFLLSETLVENTNVTKKCGVRVQSSIVLQTWVLLHHKRLACYSDKKERHLAGPTFVAYSRLLIVTIVDNEPLERAESDSIMLFLSATLCFLILFICCWYLVIARRSAKEEYKGGRGQLRLARKRPPRSTVSSKGSHPAKRRRLGVRNAPSSCVDTGKTSSSTDVRRRMRHPATGSALTRGLRPVQRWFGMGKRSKRRPGGLFRRKPPARASPSNQRAKVTSRGDSPSSQRKKVMQHHLSTIQEDTPSSTSSCFTISENLDPPLPVGKQGSLPEKPQTLVPPAEKDDKNRKWSSVDDATVFQTAPTNNNPAPTSGWTNRGSLFDRTSSKGSGKSH